MSDIVSYKLKKYHQKLEYYSKLQKGGGGKYKILFSDGTWKDSNDDQDKLVDTFLTHEQSLAYITNKIIRHSYGDFVNICFRSADNNIYIIPGSLNETRLVYTQQQYIEHKKKLEDEELINRIFVVVPIKQLSIDLQAATLGTESSTIKFGEYDNSLNCKIIAKLFNKSMGTVFVCLDNKNKIKFMFSGNTTNINYALQNWKDIILNIKNGIISNDEINTYLKNNNINFNDIW